MATSVQSSSDFHCEVETEAKSTLISHVEHFLKEECKQIFSLRSRQSEFLSISVLIVVTLLFPSISLDDDDEDEKDGLDIAERISPENTEYSCTEEQFTNLHICNCS